MKIKLSDVSGISGTPPEDGEVLIWNELLQVYVPGPMSGGGGGLVDAPADGETYARRDGEWVKTIYAGEGTPATYVQHASLRNEGTLTLAAPPTEGNLLIFAVGGFGGSIGSYTLPGFALVAQYNSNGNNAVRCYTKIAGASESNVFTPAGASDNQFCVLYEYADVVDFQAKGGGAFVGGSPSPVPMPLAGIDDVSQYIVIFEHDSEPIISFVPETGVTQDISPNDGVNHKGTIGRVNLGVIPDIQSTGGFAAPVYGVFAIYGSPAPDPFITDAPEDGSLYARKDGAWESFEPGSGGGGGDGVASEIGAHRYWGLFNLRARAAAHNVQMRYLKWTLQGGADVVPANYFASGEYDSGFLANNLKDTTETRWAELGPEGWVYADFGVPQAFDSVGILPGTANPEQSPTEGILAYSDDAITWTPLTAISKRNTTYVANTYATFGIPKYAKGSPPAADFGAHKYWRLWIPYGAGQEYAYALSKIQMRASKGGLDQCIGGNATAVGFVSGYGPEKAFDSDNATFWAYEFGTEFSNRYGWIKYEFPTPVRVNEIYLRARSDAPKQIPQHFFVQYSDDNVKFETAWDFGVNPLAAVNGQEIISSPVQIGGGGLPTPYWMAGVPALPKAADFAVVKSDAAIPVSVYEEDTGIVLEIRAGPSPNADRTVALEKTTATGVFDFKALLVSQNIQRAYQNIGLYIRNQSNGRFQTFGIGDNQSRGYNVLRWNSVGSYSSAATNIQRPAPDTPLWMRLKCDGTTLEWAISKNGKYWTVVYRIGMSDWVGTDARGVGIHYVASQVDGPQNIDEYLHVMGWRLT